MNGISERQKLLLDNLIKDRYAPRLGASRVFDFFDEKPKKELLDIRWHTVWEKYKDIWSSYLPSRILRGIEESILSIEHTSEEIWKIKIKDNTKVIFLLGAGVSAPSGIPTVDKLLPELWKRARKIGRDDIDRLVDWCDKREITNIEDLLTAAYIANFAAKNQSIISLLDYFIFSGGRILSEKEDDYITRRHSIRTSEIDVSSISFLQDTLQTLFGLLTSTMISASPNSAHESIVAFIKKHKNTSLITTNYDGCIDEAILKAGMVNKGSVESKKKKEDSSDIELIKMHGSINWAYCDSCQDVKEFDLIELKKIYEGDKLSYPVLGICKNCGGLRRPLLVPPLSLKFLSFPNLIEIWNLARHAIDEADYLIIIGYSFSEADTYINKTLSRSMTMNKNQTMVVVNTDINIVPALRERFSAHIEKFNEKRILQSYSNCEEILPEILKSMLDKNNEKKKRETTPKVTEVGVARRPPGSEGR